MLVLVAAVFGGIAVPCGVYVRSRVSPMVADQAGFDWSAGVFATVRGRVAWEQVEEAVLLRGESGKPFRLLIKTDLGEISVHSLQVKLDQLQPLFDGLVGQLVERTGWPELSTWQPT